MSYAAHHPQRLQASSRTARAAAVLVGVPVAPNAMETARVSDSRSTARVIRFEQRLISRFVGLAGPIISLNASANDAAPKFEDMASPDPADRSSHPLETRPFHRGGADSKVHSRLQRENAAHFQWYGFRAVKSSGVSA